jgi:hypothetical protein
MITLAAGKPKASLVHSLWGDITLVWHHILTHSTQHLPPTATAVFVVFALTAIAVGWPVIKFLARQMLSG